MHLILIRVSSLAILWGPMLPLHLTPGRFPCPLALVTAAVFMGMLIGGLASGDIADKFGRRFALLISMGITFVFGVSSAAAPSVGWLVAARVFAGVGEEVSEVASMTKHVPSCSVRRVLSFPTFLLMPQIWKLK